MVFSSPVFLFLFLPITLAVYFVLPRRLRNLWLLATSLVFWVVLGVLTGALFKRYANDAGATA